MGSPCHFHLHLPTAGDSEAVFRCLLAFVYCLVKYLFVFCLNSSWTVCIFTADFRVIFICFWNQSFVRYMIYKYFSPQLVICLFILLTESLSEPKYLVLMKSTLLIFFFFFGVMSKNFSPNSKPGSFSSCFYLQVLWFWILYLDLWVILS